jgi:ATP adenylyltransferase
MKNLWAPWRIKYIEESYLAKNKNKQTGCFLCVKKSKSADEKNLILKRGRYGFVIMNHYPYNAGHLMIAPYRHIGDLEKIRPAEAAELFALVQKSIVALKKAYHPDAFNIGMNLGIIAGAGVPGHLHIHLIPRWSGDTNFMPIIANTKVINEELIVMYRKLKKIIK